MKEESTPIFLARISAGCIIVGTLVLFLNEFFGAGLIITGSLIGIIALLKL